jgi:hypothetical protein
LNFDKGAQNMHWRKDNLFKKWCFECWVPTWRSLKLDFSLSPWASINPK